MEIYSCTDYNYIEHLALVLVAPWIPLTELYCTDVWLRALTAEHFWFRQLTNDDPLKHWRWLTPIPETEWFLLLPTTNWLSVVYCFPLTTSGCSNGKHSTTVARQPCNATIPSRERIHETYCRSRNGAIVSCIRLWTSYNCCQPYPGYDRCLRSNTSQYIYIYIYIYIYNLYETFVNPDIAQQTYPLLIIVRATAAI
jgi:hypothetical protein